MYGWMTTYEEFNATYSDHPSFYTARILTSNGITSLHNLTQVQIMK